MFLITASVGFLQPFVPLYLEAAGLKRGHIGFVTGFGTGLALLIQPFLGRLSDRLDARRPLMVAAALLSGLAYFGYRYANGLPAFLLLTALGINGYLYLNAVGGVLIGRMVGSVGRGGTTYAGYRVWGSVGYIVVTLFLGWLLSHRSGPHPGLSREALGVVFTYGPLLFVAIALSALFVPDRSSAPAPGTRAQQHGPLPVNLRRFLLAYFLYQFALYGASSYLSLYLKSLHAQPYQITSVFAAGVICEVLVMTRVGRFSDLYGRRPALAIAFLLMPLRLLAYIPATGWLWVLAVQTLHGLNFGIMGAIAIVFINDTATDHNRGAAQARLAAAGGLATAISPMLCGWIAQRFSIGWMFAVMAVVGAAGAVVFLTQVQESHPTPQTWTTRAPAFLHPLLRLLTAPP
jgi:PPP family 3-phenylpropionic acid transporter